MQSHQQMQYRIFGLLSYWNSQMKGAKSLAEDASLQQSLLGAQHRVVIGLSSRAMAMGKISRSHTNSHALFANRTLTINLHTRPLVF